MKTTAFCGDHNTYCDCDFKIVINLTFYDSVFQTSFVCNELPLSPASGIQPLMQDTTWRWESGTVRVMTISAALPVNYRTLHPVHNKGNVVALLYSPGTTKSPSPANSACCRSEGRRFHSQRGELFSETSRFFKSMQPVFLAYNKGVI